MRDLKVGIIQFSPIWGEIGANLSKILNFLQEGQGQGVDLFLFPEMCLSGYIFSDPLSASVFSLDPEKDEVFFRLKRAALDYGVYLAFGFMERDGQQLYNSQALISPQGECLGIYRKVHLFEVDYFWATEGSKGFMTLDTPLGRLGMGICMDLNFEDFVSFHKEQNTDLVLFSTNWLDQGIDVGAYWLERWGNFPGWVASSNRGGQEFGIPFCGSSSLLRRGQIIRSIKGKEDGLIVFPIND